MKIALINGSPKSKNSTSEYILKSLKKLLIEVDETVEYHFRTPKLSNHDLEKLFESKVLVFAFPLYGDGIPSHLLNCLCQMESYLKTKPQVEMTVYAIVNCGFYEGRQSEISLEMMKNWCDKVNLNWGQGLGIGGGGMLPSLSKIPDGQGPKKNYSKALDVIAKNIFNGINDDNIFIIPNLPRFVYKFGGHMGWRQQIKANGLKTKDLFTRK